MLNDGSVSLSDIAAVTKDNDGFGSGNGAWWVLIILFALFGWGGNNWGNNGAVRTVESGAIAENYALSSDMASIERRIDGIDEHLCNGFLNATQVAANNFAAVNQAVTSGFDNTNQNIMANGYENRLGQSQIQMQAAQNNCAVIQAIGDNTTSGIMNTNTITNQLMQNRFADQSNHCETMVAIDHVGDRIEAKLNDMEMARMQREIAQKDSEIFGLKLAASQSFQNQYLVNTLRPIPIPAYTVENPWASGGATATATTAA